MKEIIVVWLISMDLTKKNKLRDIIETIETRMELGEKNRQLLDNPHCDAPGTPGMGTEEDKGRDGGIT